MKLSTRPKRQDKYLGELRRLKSQRYEGDGGTRERKRAMRYGPIEQSNGRSTNDRLIDPDQMPVGGALEAEPGPKAEE